MPFAEPAQREEGGWCEEGSFQATCDLRAMRHHRCQQTCPKTSCKYHFSKIKCSKDISRNQGFFVKFFCLIKEVSWSGSRRQKTCESGSELGSRILLWIQDVFPGSEFFQSRTVTKWCCIPDPDTYKRCQKIATKLTKPWIQIRNTDC